MTTATDIVTSSLENIGARAAGEPLNVEDANTAFIRLNRLLDQLSTQANMIYYISTVIFDLINGVQAYTIGPKASSTTAQFTGFISGNVLTVTALASGSINLGQQIDAAAGVLAGTIITGFNPTLLTGAAGGVSTALGDYTVSKSQTTTIRAMTAYYQRPMRIANAFVRVAGLDYPVANWSQEQYSLIGQKNLNGPWPRVVYYQPAVPDGIFHVWPNPAQGQMHIGVETVLSQIPDLSSPIVLPPGYESLLEWMLSAYLIPAFGKTNNAGLIQMVSGKVLEARAIIKTLNRKPQAPARFDELPLSHRSNDAGFIFSGGFLN